MNHLEGRLVAALELHERHHLVVRGDAADAFTERAHLSEGCRSCVRSVERCANTRARVRDDARVTTDGGLGPAAGDVGAREVDEGQSAAVVPVDAKWIRRRREEV